MISLETNRPDFHQRFLTIPGLGERAQAAIFAKEIELLPPRMRNFIAILMQENSKAGFFKKRESEENLNALLEPARELISLLHKTENMPEVVEKIHIRWAKIIENQPTNEKTRRRDIREIWLDILEKGIKTAQTTFICREIRDRMISGNYLDKPSQAISKFDTEILNTLVAWCYEAQGEKYKIENGYQLFKEDLGKILEISQDTGVSAESYFKHRDKSIMPWIFMLLVGDNSEFSKFMYDKIGNSHSMRPQINLGISGVDIALGENGLEERPDDLLERLADLLYHDGYPEGIRGKIKNQEERSIYIDKGSEVKCKVADPGSDSYERAYIKKEIESLKTDFQDDGTEMHDNFGYERPALFMSLDISLMFDLMGVTGSWTKWLETMAHIKEQETTCNIPISPDEALSLMDWDLDYDLKNKVLTKAMLIAHFNRAAGLEQHHGYGGNKNIYNDQFWATLAYNLSLPENQDGIHTLTPEILTKISEITQDEEEMAQMLGLILSGRVTTVNLSVMGANDTGKDSQASTMESSSYAVTESCRAYGLYEQGKDPRPTVASGHSMGAQILERALLLLPQSVRNWVDFLSVTGVYTSEMSAMSFLKKGMNKLHPLLIKLVTNKNITKQQLGQFMSGAGDILPIKKLLLKGFTYSQAKTPMDFKIGLPIAAAHGISLNTAPEYLLGQMGAIDNSKDRHTFDELASTISTFGRDMVTRTVGLVDSVLHPWKSIKALKKSDKNLRFKNFDKMSIQEMINWVKEVEQNTGMPIEVLVAKLPHYIQTTELGRWLIRLQHMKKLKLPTYGYRKIVQGSLEQIQADAIESSQQKLNSQISLIRAFLGKK
ncbi:hypothetical protein KA089_01250 [Candidatus Woesebacteria bacterium]|nr:hypothetical protein [Candidatus Woesebacteria bacterium]